MSSAFSRGPELIVLVVCIVFCSVDANELCFDSSSTCCWRSTNSSSAWLWHEALDQTWFRRAFHISSSRLAPAGTYFSSVLGDPREISALESCEFCSASGNVKVLIRHWTTPASKLQMCWRQNATARGVRQCRELDPKRQGLVETLTVRVQPAQPIKFVLLLRSRNGKNPATGLIDQLLVRTDPCTLKIHELKEPREPKDRFFTEQSIVQRKAENVDRTMLRSTTQSAVLHVPTSLEQPDLVGKYSELLGKKRSYYDRLLEKQLLRRQPAHKTAQTPRTENRVEVRKTNGWSIPKHEQLEQVDGQVEGPEKKDALDGMDPITSMLGKEFAQFLEPNFDTSRYDEEERRREALESTTAAHSTKPPVSPVPRRIAAALGPSTLPPVRPGPRQARPRHQLQPTLVTVDTAQVFATSPPSNPLKVQPLAKAHSFHPTPTPLVVNRRNSVNPVIPLAELAKPSTQPPRQSTEPSTTTAVLTKSTKRTSKLSRKDKSAKSTSKPLTSRSLKLTSSTISSKVQGSTDDVRLWNGLTVPSAPPTWSPTTSTPTTTTTKPTTTTTTTTAATTTAAPSQVQPAEEEVDPDEFDEKTDLAQLAEMLPAPEVQNETVCEYTGGCLFENGFCDFEQSQFIQGDGEFRQVTVGESQFVEAQVAPGRLAALESRVDSDLQPFNVLFDYLAWTSGERLLACCYRARQAADEADAGSALRCPFESRRADVLWRPAQFRCEAGTEKILFICENLGQLNGICALDNVRLHAVWDDQFSEPCQKDVLNEL